MPKKLIGMVNRYCYKLERKYLHFIKNQILNILVSFHVLPYINGALHFHLPYFNICPTVLKLPYFLIALLSIALQKFWPKIHVIFLTKLARFYPTSSEPYIFNYPILTFALRFWNCPHLTFALLSIALQKFWLKIHVIFLTNLAGLCPTFKMPFL